MSLSLRPLFPQSVAQTKSSVRFVSLVDSAVCRGAPTKGRSASFSQGFDVLEPSVSRQISTLHGVSAPPGRVLQMILLVQWPCVTLLDFLSCRRFPKRKSMLCPVLGLRGLLPLGFGSCFWLNAFWHARLFLHVTDFPHGIQASLQDCPQSSSLSFCVFPMLFRSWFQGFSTLPPGDKFCLGCCHGFVWTGEGRRYAMLCR